MNNKKSIEFFGTTYIPLPEPIRNLTVYRFYNGEPYICKIRQVDYIDETFDIINLCDSKFHKLFPRTGIPFDDPNFYIAVPVADDKINDNGYFLLAGEIVRDACRCYFRKPLKIPSNIAPEHRKKIIEENLLIEKERKTAELFFRKSKIFQIMNLDPDYILEHYKNSEDYLNAK